MQVWSHIGEMQLYWNRLLDPSKHFSHLRRSRGAEKASLAGSQVAQPCGSADVRRKNHVNERVHWR